MALIALRCFSVMTLTDRDGGTGKTDVSTTANYAPLQCGAMKVFTPRQSRLAGGTMLSTCPSVRSFVRPSVTKLAQVDETINFCGPGVNGEGHKEAWRHYCQCPTHQHRA